MGDALKRHPLGRWFTYDHLPTHLIPTSQACADLAEFMVTTMGADTQAPDQLDAGLRKLIEAKDCFVRAMIARN